MRRILSLSALGSILILSGCLVGPRYKRPPVDTPAAFRGQDPAQAASIADLPWWTVFQDPALQTLIKTDNNKTRAAEILQISLKTLHNKLKEYGNAAGDGGPGREEEHA